MKNIKHYYEKAIKEGFALGAFNFANLETLKAICSAAENLKSPVIVAVSESALAYVEEDFVMALVKVAKQKYDAPIFLHLDHGKTFEICKRAVDLGFDSVMIDASSLEFDENVKLTRRVCDYAHSKGVFVEGELGRIDGTEDDVSNDEKRFTRPEEASLFVRLTEVDALAVSIGTSHGAYKFKGKSELRFDILSQIEKALPDFPLVLHGASSVNQNLIESINSCGGQISGASGVSEQLTRQAVKNHNVVKINIDTDLRIAFTAGVREYLAAHPENFDQRKYAQRGREFVEEAVRKKIEMLGSKNKA